MFVGGSNFDVIVANLLEGLPVPNASSMPKSISNWNKHDSSHIEALFEFAYAYLVDNACMLIMIPKLKILRGDVMTYAATYESKIAKD